MTAHPVPVERSTAVAHWSEEQAALIKQAIAPECSDEFLAFFAQVCRHRDLDPFAGEICAIPRRTKKKDGRGERWETVHTIQVTVDGLRNIAGRSGLYGGQDAPEWCGPDHVWHDVWLGEGPPAAARVRVYRKDYERPIVGVARYASYVQLFTDRDTGEITPKGLWATGPDFMLAKCAEAQALKRGFPRQLAALGIEVREDLSLPSVISMEARQVGMGDDERHALVAEVTEGRTESTRELEDAEALEVRRRIAEAREQARTFPAGASPPVLDQGGGPAPVASTPPRASAPLVEQVAEEDTLAERQAREWAGENALANVMPSWNALHAAADKGPLNEVRAELTEQGISWRPNQWSIRDCQRVAEIIQEKNRWVDPRSGEGPGADPERPF